MAVIYTLNDGKKVYEETVTGPTSYTTGGFQVQTSLSFIYPETIQVSVISPLQTSDYVHAVEVVAPTSTAPNVITIKVHRINVTSASPSAWAEVPATTNISGLKLNIRAIGV